MHKKQISFCCCCSWSSFTKINESIWWIFPICSVPLTSMDTVVKKCFCRKITVRKKKILCLELGTCTRCLFKYILRQECGIKKYLTFPHSASKNWAHLFFLSFQPFCILNCKICLFKKLQNRPEKVKEEYINYSDAYYIPKLLKIGDGGHSCPSFIN